MKPLLFIYYAMFNMAEKFSYGGQAVIEGVMMRGQRNMVTVVRRPNGELTTDTRALPTFYTNWMRKTPLIRGVIVLIEAMALGFKTLIYSANVSLEEEGETVGGWFVWTTTIVSFAFAVVVFFVGPLFLTRLFNVNSTVLFHLLEGCVRLAIFIAYLKLMTLMPDIKRVFAYHGAEHKVVNTYEAGVPLEVEAVKAYSTAHTRCGTSFLFVVLVIAILVFALIGIPSLWLMVLSRIVLIPVIAALGYEVIYFAGRHSNNRLVRIVLAPGLWLQSLTTREPDEKQLEVAILALSTVIEADKTETAT